MKKLIITLLCLPLFLNAQEISGTNLITNADTPIMTTEVIEDDRPFNPKMSHWVNSFGFEEINYPVPYEFDGIFEDIKPEKQSMWGGRLGFGREFYLGARVNTTTKLESYYVGTLFSRSENLVNDNDDVELSYTKRTGNVWGIDLVQSIGVLFDMKTKNPFMDEWSYLIAEPYVEAGVGVGWACNKISYNYDLDNIIEAYRQKVCDDLLNTRLGGGINFTSTTGYFLFLKAFVNNYNITKRKTKTYESPDGGSATTVTESLTNVNIDPIMTYSIGGGYKF
jgi:hypothetical protein